jgi:tripartite-type tricarboxylate transporter receptor subunit TctC
LIKHFATAMTAAWTVAAAPAFAADSSSPNSSSAAWPMRPVTIVCPFAAGISTDLVARALAAALSDKLGQQFVVEDRPGANGNIGAATVAKAAPDGYTLLSAIGGAADDLKAHLARENAKWGPIVRQAGIQLQ